ncbi:MAG: tetratricopeptide repeat protein [Desulfatitalea sp.]|nr:tetratricopeptide repeat protein [Desulfatitalea sp.]
MKINRRVLFSFITACIVTCVTLSGIAFGQIKAGQTAPAFTLPDLAGQQHGLTTIEGRQMTVLFFFDAGSDASQGGLLVLDRLLRQYDDRQLSVWGITRSDTDAVRRFNQNAQLQFPVLLDAADVSRQYNATTILPVVCVLGPGREVLDYFQGGGATVEVMLTRLAERQIHRNQPRLAEAMAEAATRQNPDNPDAQAVRGYAALAQGRNDEARKVFDQLAARSDPGTLIGQEGQAAVLAREGQADKALALAEAVTRKAPQRVMAHKIKGDVLIGKGDRTGAAAAYQSAATQSQGAPFQKAEAFNQLGRLYADQGQYGEARKLFDNAVAMDPYYLEPTSNKGVTFEKEGMWNQALTEYRKTLALDQTDTIATVLARKAEQVLSLQQDSAGRNRMDQLVNTLVERYKRQQIERPAPPEDEWTSRPLILSFVDIQERGGLSSRDGLAIVLATRLGELLAASGRVQVVERVVMERLLSELNLGSSELADPDTALKLGRLLAAKLIGTGSLLYMPDSTMIHLRLIDTETSAIAKTVAHPITSRSDLERELFDLNRSILKTVMETYPLQGYIVQMGSQEAMINLGRNQGVTTGTTFAVLEPGAEMTYRGRVLRGAMQTVGKLEVVRVEPDLSYARIVEQNRTLARDDQIREVLTELAATGRTDGR